METGFKSGAAEAYSLSTSYSSALKEVAFGSIAGIVSELFEYPFDLAKVRLQGQVLDTSSTRFAGPWDCLKRTWHAEGIRGLYRGLPIPMIASTAESGAVFLAYHQFRNLIRNHNNDGKELNIAELGLAAGGAGLVTSFILTPLELVKCKMQVQMVTPKYRNSNGRSLLPLIPTKLINVRNAMTATQPSSLTSATARHQTTVKPLAPPGAVAIVSNIIKTQGYRGLWVGHVPTMVLETAGTALWFTSKEFFAHEMISRRTALTPAAAPLPTSWESMISGALSGALCVVALYPIDTIKSAQQTHEDLGLFPNRKGSVGFVEMARALFKARGMNGLFAGCGMSLARAVPSSGIVFVAYDGLSQRFGN